jgi:hypothetical protein
MEMAFADDTPIKGHKLKYMSSTSSNMIAQLAERYFARVNVKESSGGELDKKVVSSNKNEDQESGVESDELNENAKKLLNVKAKEVGSLGPTDTTDVNNKITISDKYMQRYRSIYSLQSPPLVQTNSSSASTGNIFHVYEFLIK